ncbi:MAG: phosphoglucosamine mutase [Eubacteriales bacterium]|nr:phosphoglucosamine mutase [Eubacteriales bacterium]
MGRLFGTDGVRGVANTELTPELAFKIGQAGAYVLTEEAHARPKIIIGKDTRISGDMLEAALIAGICSTGAQAVSLGVIPTPAIAYLTVKYGADAGIVISASHNPSEYNGIKYFNRSGYKLRDEIEERIEKIILDGIEKVPAVSGDKVGRWTGETHAPDDYVDFAKKTIDINLKGMKIAVDCANGASSVTAPRALNELGAEVLVINDKPDGVNINLGCGSTHMEGLMKFTAESGADIGLAFDGDADRVLISDENGNYIDGDQIMAVCALRLMEEEKLSNNTLVATVMSNSALSIMTEKNGIKMLRTKVGDRYVLEEMLKGGYTIGGEQSGHVIFLNHNTTGDGLITALQFISAMRKTGRKASDLASVVKALPQVLVNAKAGNDKKNTYLDHEEIRNEIRSLEDSLEGKGRVLIRVSGTEPLVRVMLEGEDIEYLNKRARALAELIETKLG